MSPREPLVGGAATGSSRVPIRYQFQTTECGVATLASILAYFGHDLSMERVRELTGVSRDCVTAADLLHAGRELGFECKARRCEPDDLAALGLPVIVHLNFIHFVVVEEITDDVVRVMDPNGGPHEILRERFDDSFTGIALSFRPPAPSSAADPPSVPQGLSQRLAHFLGRAGIQALCATAAMHVAASIAVAAAISQLAAGAFPVAAGLLGLALALEFVANRRLASLGRTTVRRWRERLLRGVMAQGPAFFAYRIPGPLRDAMVQPELTARQLCTALIPACCSLATLPVWVLAAVWIHPVAGGMLASALTVGVGFVVWRVRHPDGRYGTGHTDSRSAEAALAVQLMQIESWRTGVRPRDFALAAIDADASAQAERQRRLELLLPLPAYRWLPLPCLLFTLAGIALLQPLTWVDLLALALLALAMGRALEPAAALPDELMALEKDLVQLEDFEDSTGLPVAGAQSPESSNEPPLANGAVLAAWDLSFAHAPRQPLVFEGLELELFAGEQLGITGPSGGGKSTLARLLAGIEQPRTGSVRIAPEVLPVGWLEKSPILFQASVRENLCLGRQDLDDERLWQALADACLDDVIAGRPGGLDALLHPGGRSLSGGQEQRLELAQALLHGAQLLVIDEALDGLNPTLEMTLRKRLHRRGCTLVVVSHRAATLARCDRVLRLYGGALLPVDPASFTEGPAVESKEPGGAAVPAAAASSLNMPGSDAMAASMAKSVPVDGGRMHEAAGLAAVVRVLTCTEEERSNPQEDLADPFPDALWDAGFTLRELLMRHRKWWHYENGPLLACSRSPKEAAGILPSWRGPRLVEASGRRRPLSPEQSQALSERPFRLYPPVCLEPAGFVATLLRALRGSGLDGWAWGLAGLLLALGLAAGPLALAAVFDTGMGGERSPLEGLRMALALLLALAGGMLISEAAWHFRARIEDRTRHGYSAAFASRLARIDVAFILDSAREDVIAAARALAATLTEWPGRLLDAAVHATILVALLVLMFFVAVPAAFGIALMACALVVAAFCGLGWWRSASLEHWIAGEMRQRTLLLRQLVAQGRLRALGAHARLLEQWLSVDRRLLGAASSIDWTEALQRAVASVGPWFAVVLALAVLGPEPLASTPAITLLGLMLVWLGIDRAAKLGEALAAAMDIQPHVRRLERLTRAPAEPRLPRAGAGLPQPACLPIEARDVVVRRGTQTVLDGLSWSISAGEAVGIAGVSGSGKSTLVEVLLGFRAPDQGVVRVAGTDLAVMDRPRWRQRLGTVLQGERLERSITIRGHLMGGVPAPNDRLWAALREVEFAAEVEAMPMGIQTIADDIRLSTGQRQRLLLARALLRDPELLLLDEALNAIPVAMQARIMARLRARGIACVVITHDATLLRELDRIDVLDAGRIVCSAAPAEAMADPRLRRILDVERLTS